MGGPCRIFINMGMTDYNFCSCRITFSCITYQNSIFLILGISSPSIPVNQLKLLMQGAHYIALILIWTHQGGLLVIMVTYSLHLYLQPTNQGLEMVVLQLILRMSHRYWRVSM
jgi:hypothetical protein